jgi:hypothetical protein
VERSDALHGRVRAFAAETSGESFDELALDIARFQARHSAGMAKLVALHDKGLDATSSIPPVPAKAFRLARVAVHPPALDAARFVTSGTTGAASGVHALRSLETYRVLAIRLGRRALFGSVAGKWTIVALAPRPARPPASSLGFMMHELMAEFDGRPFAGPATDVAADGASWDSPARWLVRNDTVDVAGLERAARTSLDRGEPLCVLATSFALVALLDALDGAVMPAPAETLVMHTGGFKGRTREVDAVELRTAVARAFAVSPERVVGEYGMTELTSQLYEGTAPGAELVGAPGSFLEPAWLRAIPVDPVSLDPVADGDVGIAKFVDLGNVDSAVAVVTEDLSRRHRNGIELVGRRRGAPARGCSLAVEGMLIAGNRAADR